MERPRRSVSVHHEQKWEQEGNGLKYTVPRPRWLLPRLTPFWHIDYDHTQISIMEGKGGWQKPMPCLSRGLDKRMSNVVCRRRKALGMWHCIQQVVFLTLSSAVVGGVKTVWTSMPELQSCPGLDKVAKGVCNLVRNTPIMCPGLGEGRETSQTL